MSFGIPGAAWGALRGPCWCPWGQLYGPLGSMLAPLGHFWRPLGQLRRHFVPRGGGFGDLWYIIDAKKAFREPQSIKTRKLARRCGESTIFEDPRWSKDTITTGKWGGIAWPDAQCHRQVAGKWDRLVPCFRQVGRFGYIWGHLGAFSAILASFWG